MKRFVLAVVLVPLIVVAAEPSKPQPGVNWAGQVVRATGQGAPDLKAQNPAQARLGAEMAAKADALRNLLAQVKGISVDGTRKMGDLMEKDEIRTRVEGVVRGFKITNKRYFSDSGVEVEIEVPLAMLTDVVDPDATQMLAVAAAATAPNAKPEVKVEADKLNTGLVIDARGLKVTPSLMPRLLDEGGKAVYSIDFLSSDARKQSAVAAYVQNIDDAQKSQKVGEKPLVLKAVKATGADLQLAPEDARKLAALNTSLLADARVVIVLN
jgi:hypothetical protein